MPFERLRGNAVVEAAAFGGGTPAADAADYDARGEFARTHLRLGDMRFCTASGLFPGDRALPVTGHGPGGPRLGARVMLVDRTYLSPGGWCVDFYYEDELGS
jgi:hypothetical protein